MDIMQQIKQTRLKREELRQQIRELDQREKELITAFWEQEIAAGRRNLKIGSFVRVLRDVETEGGEKIQANSVGIVKKYDNENEVALNGVFPQFCYLGEYTDYSDYMDRIPYSELRVIWRNDYRAVQAAAKDEIQYPYTD